MSGREAMRAAMLGRDMTEDELMLGVTDALTLAGWYWVHIRRSDGVTMGMAGLPDIIAIHPASSIVLTWELKSTDGKPTLDQQAWLNGLRGKAIDARVIRPADYDVALDIILHPR